MASEERTSKKRKQPEPEVPETEETSISVAARFFANLAVIEDLEAELRRRRIANREFLAKHPFLGNMLGNLRKVGGRKKEEEKGKEVSTESPMEEVVEEPLPRAPPPRETPRQRLEKRIRRDAPVIAGEQRRIQEKDLQELRETGRYRG
jgi:hypothetical protein